MKRDILNYQGTKIGELEMPDDTTEETWAAMLAPYAVEPKDPVRVAKIATIKERKEYSDDFMQRFKLVNQEADINIMQAFWVHHRLRAVPVTLYGVDFVIDIMNMAVSGDVEAACVAFMNMAPDDMSLPYHFFTQERLDWIVNDMKTYLGWS